jgi:hypothetical protein
MEFGDYNGFAQIGGTHQAHSYSATGNITTYDQPGFSTYDASLGVSKDAWTAQLYGQNLTNTRADLFENGNQFVTAETINRPRTAGVKFSYKFYGARERRLPGIEDPGDKHGVRAVRAEVHIGDIGRRDGDDAHQFPGVVHHQHPARAVLRNVVVAVGTQFEAVGAVVSILVRGRRRQVLQPRPHGARSQRAVGIDGKRQDAAGQHFGDQQILPSLDSVRPFE